MKIYIEDKVLEFKNNKQEIDNIFVEIDKIIKNSSKILSYMVIDNMEIFENYHDYLLENIKSIEEVTVVSQTYKELVNDIINTTYNYLDRTPELIDDLANSFYKVPTQKSWNDLGNLLGGISWIISTFSSIDNDNRLKDTVNNYEDWNIYAKDIYGLNEIIVDLEEGLKNNDNILVADILSYEIAEKFTEMKEKLSALTSLEADLNDLN